MKEFLTDNDNKVLEVELRRRLYGIVKESAGCHFREIERRSSMPTGLVQYHLDYLARHGLIRAEKEKGSLRYFPRDFKSENKKVMSMLRQRSVRQILLFILLHEGCIHEDIVRKVRLSPSTVSWHLRKLEEASVISSEKQGRKTHFRIISDKEEIKKLLIAYRESFLDSIVDNVVEMWEGGWLKHCSSQIYLDK